MSRILMMVANPTSSPTVGWPIGFWLSELAHPYWSFIQEGHEVTVASLNGGQVVPDGFSDPENAKSSTPGDFVSVGFARCSVTSAILSNTLKLSDVDPHGYDAIFVVGGLSPMVTFIDSDLLHEVFASFYDTGRVAAAICHGTCILLRARRSDGELLVDGKRWTGFANSEEDAVDAGAGRPVQPFRIEDEAAKLPNTTFVAGPPYRAHAIADGNLITGQQGSSGHRDRPARQRRTCEHHHTTSDKGRVMTYTSRRVSIPSGDIQMVGVLCSPDHADHPTPAFAIIGPIGFVKEQSPMQYATRLARLGYTTLVFDPRHFGETGGEPLQYDSPALKAADLSAAVAFLAKTPTVDPSRIGVIGVCMGANWAAAVAAQDPTVSRVALVVGAYLLRTKMVAGYVGKQGFDDWVAATAPAYQHFLATGETDYRPMIAERMEDSFFNFDVPYAWYSNWVRHEPLNYRGRWGNELATVSEHLLWQHDAEQSFRSLSVPTLIINSTDSATDLATVEHLVEQLQCEHQLVVTGDQIQVQFYDDPLTIDLAVDHIDSWARS